MYQSFTVPKLASLVSCLLNRDTGSRYGAHVEDVKDVGLTVELKAGNGSENAFSGIVSMEWAGPPEENIQSCAATEKSCGQLHSVYKKCAFTAPGRAVNNFDAKYLSKCAECLGGHEENLNASHEKVKLVVQDMTIVGTSSLQKKQVDTSVADSRWGSVVKSFQYSKLCANGCAPLKRERSHQDVEEARAEKRVKVESSVGLLPSSLKGNGMGPSVPNRGVGEYQDTNPGDQVATRRDDWRLLVPAVEFSAPAPNDTDLTDLLNDLDDVGAPDLDDDKFGGESHLCGLGNWSIENRVQAHSPQAETIAKALNISSEWIQTDDDRKAKVQAQSPLHETITKAQEPSSEQTQMDGDIGCMVQAHDAIRKERPSTEIVILDSDSDDEDDDDDEDILMFDHLSEIYQSMNVVKPEPGTGKVEVNISQLEGAVKIEPECLRQPEKSYQLKNAVKVEPQIQTHPDTSYQLKNVVKVEPGNLEHPKKSSMLVPKELSNETPDLVPSDSSHVANGVKFEFGGIRQAPVSMGSRAFEAFTMLGIHREGQEQTGIMLQTIMKDGRLMWDVVPPNANATLGPPYSDSLLQSRLLQANCLPSGLPNGVGCSSKFAPRNDQEFFSSEEQAVPGLSSITIASSTNVSLYRGHMQPLGMENGNHAIGGQAVVSVPSPFQPAGNVQEAAASGEQAGPSHGWTPPISSAVVPHHYDSAVSIPRQDVVHTMEQFYLYNKKAKDDRNRELLARRKSSPDELVKGGNRKGCRTDIVAYNDIKKAKADVNPGVNVGDLPGVVVGDRFDNRHMMAVVGLHRLPYAGIDYGYPPPDMIPTATAIVLKPQAGYVDDKDYGNIIFYTGQGGRKLKCDQELKKGNLALVNNFERKLPVRVIRGHTGKAGVFLGYSYDGLYTILSYDFSVGITGCKVFKFHMERLEDQPPIRECKEGCRAHPWNTREGDILAPIPLQAKDPTMDVKPILLQAMGPQADLKQICT